MNRSRDEQPLHTSHPQLVRAGGSRRPFLHRGFTLIELLVVIAIIAIIAAIMLPVLTHAKIRAQAVGCLNNTKQLMLGWLLYAGENNDIMMDETKWVAGSMDSQTTPGKPWTGPSDCTNAAIMVDPTLSLMANYIKNPGVYKCPGDFYQAPADPGARVRTYSMNSAVGGKVGTVGGTYSPEGTRIYVDGNQTGDHRISVLNKPGPSQVWVILDEHPDSISDAVFQFQPGWALTSYAWQDMPASLHDGSCSLSFADGHSVIHKWMDGRTKQRVEMRYKYWQPGVGSYLVGLPTPSQDYAWMNEGMPYR